MRPAERLVAVLCVLACLPGCGERRYDRAEVVGMLMPVQAPLPSSKPVLVALPPMTDLSVPGDRPDGSVDAEVDQLQFLQDHGFPMPSYVPPAADPVDARVITLGRLAEDLAAVRALLNHVFAGSAAPAAGATPPAGGTAPVNASAALVLPPQDWAGLTARLVAVTKAIDRVRTATAEPGAPAPGVELWSGLDDAAQRILIEASALGEDGVFAQLRRHPRHGQAIEDQLTAVRAAAATIVRVVTARSADELARALEALQARTAVLTSGPTATLAWGPHHGEEPEFTREERDASRRRMARLTQGLADLAGLWASNSARLVAHSASPTLVYSRPEIVK